LMAVLVALPGQHSGSMRQADDSACHGWSGKPRGLRCRLPCPMALASGSLMGVASNRSSFACGCSGMNTLLPRAHPQNVGLKRPWLEGNPVKRRCLPASCPGRCDRTHKTSLAFQAAHWARPSANLHSQVPLRDSQIDRRPSGQPLKSRP
jgi:hypothetical protein